jgi:hypothetical protein
MYHNLSKGLLELLGTVMKVVYRMMGGSQVL